MGSGSGNIFTDVLEALPGLAYHAILTDQRYLSYVNSGVLTLTGYTRAELADTAGFESHFVHDDDVPNVLDNLKQALEQGLVYNLTYRLACKAGHAIWVRDQGQGTHDQQGQLVCQGFIQDITETYRLGLQLSYHATHDSLTSLVNRRHFEQRLEKVLAYARAFDQVHTLCYLDLDQFKLINDTAGHEAGDVFLSNIATLLCNKVRRTDTVARVGGDEFGILLMHCAVDRGAKFATQLIEAIRGFRFSWQGCVFEAGGSIGLVEINTHSASVSEVLSQSDMACYTAKSRGRNRVQAFQYDDIDSNQRRADALQISRLREALAKDDFLLYCQPIRSLSEEKTSAFYEIFLRLKDPDGALILPGAFVPAAERYGLMPEIDKWVIETLLHRYGRLFKPQRDYRFSVNLSGRSLQDPSLFETVKRALDESALQADQLCFEITETAAIQNFKQALEFIEAVRALGCQFALDDFGSGFSSFNYLKHFTADYIKIDGSFIRSMAQTHQDRVVVAAIIEIGHLLGMQAIAESVESDEVISLLRVLEVDYVQGNAIANVVPLDQQLVIGL
jgi:diguanylate cyclase (GGDEF)-like protein/PAS domain S-box-containing protein